MDQSSAIPRPSGIPRPATSRLPVLRSAGSQSQLRAPASTEQLRKKPSVSSISRPTQPVAALQKKTSRASLVRSNTPSATAPATTTASRAPLASSNRRVSGIPSFGPPRTTTAPSTVDAPAFKRPYARPPSRQTKPPPQTAPPPGSKENDTLGSLDDYRSASRASSRTSSRAGLHEANPETEPAKAPTNRKSRPSLSERTVESLSQLPPSPAGSKARRRSSFFGADNSMPPPLRPASAMSNNSRPTTSDGTPQAHPATPKKFGAFAGRLPMTVPGKRSVSASVNTPTSTPSRAAPMSRPVSTVKKQPLSQAQNIPNTPKPRPLSNSKSMVARTPKPRPSLSGTFGQAISPPGTAVAAPITPSPSRITTVKNTPDTVRKIPDSSTALREQIAKAKAARKSDVAPMSDELLPKGVNSSNALREQIAKARETARRNKVEPTRTNTPPKDVIVPDPAEIAGFDFGLDDPFNQQSKGSKSLLRKRIDGARVDGRLNVAAMGLKEIPDDILTMYKYDPNDTTVAWGEVVDLDVMLLADNELETLPEAMFPDVNPEEMIDSDEAGPQFGGVQSIDLHGNMLRELPLGLGRLTQLSKLNLSRNKLPMEVMDVVARIFTLRELKLAENDLRGDLSAALCSLKALEVLDLQANKLTSLPEEIGQLVHLRSLNVTDNQLSSISMELFTSVPLNELLASKNRITGPFFSIGSAPHLQELNLANNSLMSLCDGTIMDLPAIRTINVSTNRLTSLPNVSSWVSLSALLVGENKLKALPEGFVTLPQLRNADFTANDLTQLDEKIALMGQLTNLIVAANPLREKKFLSMNTEDIKRDLLSRVQPADGLGVSGTEEPDGIVIEEAVNHTGWQLTRTGGLDLSGQDMDELDECQVLAFEDANDVRQLHLQQNTLASIPVIVSHFTHLSVLDLSKNNVEAALTSPLELFKLRDLRLAGNKLTSLVPLTTHLSAPSLQTLDISHNRVTGSLPILHAFFPELITLLASDNSISEVSADSLTGLKIVNLSNNDIERLEPQIGLLQGTLTGLEIEGNKFRVPNWQVLRKGTDAVLAWLRDKIPRESWKSDGTETFFDADDGSF